MTALIKLVGPVDCRGRGSWHDLKFSFCRLFSVMLWVTLTLNGPALAQQCIADVNKPFDLISPRGNGQVYSKGLTGCMEFFIDKRTTTCLGNCQKDLEEKLKHMGLTKVVFSYPQYGDAHFPVPCVQKGRRRSSAFNPQPNNDSLSCIAELLTDVVGKTYYHYDSHSGDRLEYSGAREDGYLGMNCYGMRSNARDKCRYMSVLH